MKWIKWALIALLAVPGVSLAQTWGTDGVTPTGDFKPSHVGGKGSDGKTRVFGTDTQGRVLQGDPDREWVTIATNVITNVAPNCPCVGFADSSQAIPTTGWKELAIRFYARPTNLRTISNTLGISWRGSIVSSTDSLSAARWAEFNDTPAAAISHGDSIAYTVWATTAVANDSTRRRTAYAGEIVFTSMLNPWGEYWYHIPLANRQGVMFTADYTSIKVRNLEGYSQGDSSVAYGAAWSRNWGYGKIGTNYQCFRVDLIGRR